MAAVVKVLAVDREFVGSSPIAENLFSFRVSESVVIESVRVRLGPKRREDMLVTIDAIGGASACEHRLSACLFFLAFML